MVWSFEVCAFSSDPHVLDSRSKWCVKWCVKWWFVVWCVMLCGTRQAGVEAWLALVDLTFEQVEMIHL